MIEVKLHDIGEGMTEADITHFFVKVGDRVKADEPIVEVQTDKMVAEIPAPKSGVVKEIVVGTGETISVGTTVMIIEDESTVVTQPSNQQPENKSKSKRIMASPYTRKIARENGINIEQIQGSGPGGRITDEDVYSQIRSNSSPIIVEELVTESKTVVPIKPYSTDIPFKGRRKQIGKKMQQSLITIPHCTHFEEIDVTELMNIREHLKEEEIKISANAFFLKAISLTLKEFPIFNAVLDEENEVIRLLDEHHLGIATDTEDGLIVPVVRNVEKKNLKQLHTEMKDLTKKALENKLSIQEVSGGTFTISNVGPLGGSIGATPIINYPEVALLSFHKTKKMPVVNKKDEIVVRSMMNVSMSFDHRVVDGATAVKFTNHFAKLIENPTFMLLELV
ncbi:2-oxo acid dehydrogenase subunit E2 [Bacillus sp. RD4P76]|uniref:Dihydrolipoamide acetyltransferase component of pyruvate dehydrogenase complex n=1 Tax=Bacillus suaedaesalsae TaxID=2810349 RepID=A0ABS2DLS6_9BACI|nr:dihydrolipoamide acetyltransferase family protein [Bacillus suaedaesalsae]MBM6619424.1 2-oxo acid dehydrogenase subunit E2 [Bacillus suaedaesalsae]